MGVACSSGDLEASLDRGMCGFASIERLAAAKRECPTAYNAMVPSKILELILQINRTMKIRSWALHNGPLQGPKKVLLLLFAVIRVHGMTFPWERQPRSNQCFVFHLREHRVRLLSPKVDESTHLARLACQDLWQRLS